MSNLYEKVAMKFRHGQFRLVDRGGNQYDILGTGPYQGEHMGTVASKWPHRVKKTHWRKRKREADRTRGTER